MMFLRCIVLVVFATLASFNSAASEATNTSKTAQQTETRKLVPSDDGTTSKGSRHQYLRILKTTIGNEEDTGVNDEERGGQGVINKFLGRHDFDMKTLSRMMDDDILKLQVFKKWDLHKQSIGKIRERLYLDYNPHFEKLLLQYLNNYKHTAQKVKKLKPTKPKRPTGNVRFTLPRE